MNHFNECEDKILDVIRAGHSLGENVLFSISPADRRSAAIKSLIEKVCSIGKAIACS